MKTICYGNLITTVERIKSILALPEVKKILIITTETPNVDTLVFSTVEEMQKTFRAINTFLSSDMTHLDLNSIVLSINVSIPTQI